MEKKSCNDTVFELVPYKELIKKLNHELDLSRKERDIDTMKDISYTIEDQKDYLDSIDLNELDRQVRGTTLTAEDLKEARKLLKEKKTYLKYEKEIDCIIKEDYKGYNELRNSRNTRRAIFGLIAGSAVVCGLGVGIMTLGKSNQREENTETTTTNSTKTTEDIKTNSNTTVTTETNKDNNSEVNIVVIKDNTEKTNNKDTKKEEKIETNKQKEEKNKVVDNKDTTKKEETKKQEEKKKDDVSTKDTDKKTDSKKKDNTDKSTDKKKTDEENNKKDDNNKKKTDEENNKYVDIEPSTIVKDNLNDNKDDVVEDKGKSDQPLPSTDYVDGEPVNDNKDNNDNKGNNNDNNTVLPPVNDDTVIGDDEGIEYDIHGSSKKIEKILGRGIYYNENI